MTTTASALATVRDLRPQAYGTVPTSRIPDPIVEPQWTGIRVLAAAGPTAAAMFDEDGVAVVDFPWIEAGLRASVPADEVVVDGYLTKQAAHDGTGVDIGGVALPSATEVIGQMFIGTHRQRKERAERIKREQEALTFRPDEPVVFVATDLLYLDGESLLDVPLLERKRLLEATVVESDLIRRGIFVRPPIETWVSTWRALGFDGLTYKAANGRYRPGGTKDDWATADLPAR